MRERRQPHVRRNRMSPWGSALAIGLLMVSIPGPMKLAGAADPPSSNPAESDLHQAARERISQLRFPVESFSFVRVRYRSDDGRRGGSWATDYPDADLAISRRLAEVTPLKVDPNGKVMQLTDDDLQDYPFLYLSEPGRLSLSDKEAAALRTYLESGGFLMVDDFWGDNQWRNLQIQLVKVFPQMSLKELPLSHPIFHCVYDLKEKPQVCSIAAAMKGRDRGVSWELPDGMQVRYRGLFDDRGRLMAVLCHNTDLADGWERHDDVEWYAREFSEKRAFPMGINIIVYALTQGVDQKTEDDSEAGQTDALKPSKRAAQRDQAQQHQSRRHYPLAVLEVKDPSTGHTISVEPGGATIRVKDRDGVTQRTLMPIDGMRRESIVGAPVIRHLAIGDHRLFVTIGKHLQVTYDVNSWRKVDVASD